ncbi:DUF3456 domain [Micractinium conductrix]|uniref:DUF3456 domain n=1 Tax=Micractinium conductrix TaxID=554055 RepID=A0A2P6VQ99_9CHLO|nr:DUF3456 domain [Micractinium conductrix]|eukprot:PSC76262.1 DUF3456 domain [Micractinium conductrix]
MRPASLLPLLLIAAAAVSGAAGQGGPPKVHPRTEDIPYIQCQVCELLAKNAWKQVKDMTKAASPTNKVDEMRIIELMEKITTAWRPEGEWMARLDLVEEGDRLAVAEMEAVGNCGVECKTVERAAELIMGEHDTDAAEVLFTGKKNRAQFNNWLCYELTGVCKSKPPPLPKGRTPGPAFQPKGEGDADLDRVMGQMQDQGMKGSLWSREELMAKYGMPEGAEGSDNDEEIDELDVPATPAPVPPVQQVVEAAAGTAQRAVQAAAGAAQRAAAAARQGVRAAAAKARGLVAGFKGRLQERRARQEL